MQAHTGSLQLVVGDGTREMGDMGPFNAIHVGAAAPELPQHLVDALAPGGSCWVGNQFLDIPVRVSCNRMHVVCNGLWHAPSLFLSNCSATCWFQVGFSW